MRARVYVCVWCPPIPIIHLCSCVNECVFVCVHAVVFHFIIGSNKYTWHWMKKKSIFSTIIIHAKCIIYIQCVINEKKKNSKCECDRVIIVYMGRFVQKCQLFRLGAFSHYFSAQKSGSKKKALTQTHNTRENATRRKVPFCGSYKLAEREWGIRETEREDKIMIIQKASAKKKSYPLTMQQH